MGQIPKFLRGELQPAAEAPAAEAEPLAAGPQARNDQPPLAVSTGDPELAAMIVCAAWLGPLSPAARQRVLEWMGKRLADI